MATNRNILFCNKHMEMAFVGMKIHEYRHSHILDHLAIVFSIHDFNRIHKFSPVDFHTMIDFHNLASVFLRCSIRSLRISKEKYDTSFGHVETDKRSISNVLETSDAELFNQEKQSSQNVINGVFSSDSSSFTVRFCISRFEKSRRSIKLTIDLGKRMLH